MSLGWLTVLSTTYTTQDQGQRSDTPDQLLRELHVCRAPRADPSASDAFADNPHSILQGGSGECWLGQVP